MLMMWAFTLTFDNEKQGSTCYPVVLLLRDDKWEVDKSIKLSYPANLIIEGLFTYMKMTP